VNLPLHFGWLGVLEAALIAFALGMLCFAFWHWLARRARWPQSRAIGWACVSAVAIGAGIDSWNLFYLGVARLESPLYARLALQGIHDADSLGTRVVFEVIGALTGTVVGWWLFSGRHGHHDTGNTPE